MAEREWNQGQEKAIFAQSGTVLVCAAAGSGKTSVLVERIVTMLTRAQTPVPPGSLLVVTFTNAAAAEMRTRIRVRLGEYMKTASADRRTVSLLKARLEEMQVCTMDSYCMRLVKEYASVLDILPDFEIMDGGAEEVLAQEAVTEAINERYRTADDAFIALTQCFESGSNDAALRKSILQLSKFSTAEPDPEAWLDTVARYYTPTPAGQSVWGREIISYMISGTQYMNQLYNRMMTGLKADEKLDKKYSVKFSVLAECLNLLTQALNKGDWDEITAAVNGLKNGIAACRFSADKGYEGEIHRESARAIKATLKDITDDFLSKLTATELEHREDIAVLAPIAGALVNTVKRYREILLAKKKELNTYSFADISHFALSLLYDEKDSEHKTELARNLSEGYHEILIDEYQDTNRAQDTLFTCLSVNGENMFTVGDVKQSIYRFRLASPEIFSEHSRLYPHYDGIAKKSKIILAQNYRSRQGITHAVNTVFGALMSRECGEIDYNTEDSLHFGATYYPLREGADVAFWLIDGADSDSYTLEARQVAKTILQEMKTGEVCIKNGTRKPEFKDFCILLRSVKGVAPEFARVLRQAGIPVYTEAGEEFFEKAQIRMAISLLRAVDDPSRDVDLLSFFMSPLCAFTPDTVTRIKCKAHEHYQNKRYSLYNGLCLLAEEGDGECQRVLSLIKEWREKSAAENAYQTVKRIFDETSMISTVRCMREGAIKEADIRLLLSYAESYSADGTKELSSFVKHLERLQTDGAQPNDQRKAAPADCVRIMTVHRSKGLEYPYVFLCGTTKQNQNRSESGLYVSHEMGIGMKRREPEQIKNYHTLTDIGVSLSLKQKELSEEMRIYYVAMTRAKERLYIIAAPENLRENLRELEYTMINEEKLPAFAVQRATPAWKWFAMAFLRHPDAGELRSTPVFTENAGKADIHILPPIKQELVPEMTAEEVQPDIALTERLFNQMEYTYPYAQVAELKSKHTASTLNSEHFSPEFFAVKRPAFMCQQGLTAAQRGTATHLFLQYCDFEAAKRDVNAERNRLVLSGRLTALQADGVHLDSVARFFASPLYARIQNAETVFREKEFCMAVPLTDLNPEVSGSFADEKTVVIGKIDLILIENGKAVIVDYKTDRVEDVSALVYRYEKQMQMYTRAVKLCLGYEVKECLLYSLTKKEWVSVLP